MSICLVRLMGEVCKQCEQRIHVAKLEDGRLVIATEINDLHTNCLLSIQYFEMLFETDEGVRGQLYKQVLKKSPWHRQLRWYNQVARYVRWNWQALLVLFLIIFSLIYVASQVGGKGLVDSALLYTIMWSHQ